MRILAFPLLFALSGCIASADAPAPLRRGSANPPGFHPPDPPGGGPAPMAAIPLLQPIWPLTAVEFGEGCPNTRARLPAVDRPAMSLSAAREVLEECDIERRRGLIDREIQRMIASQSAENCRFRNQLRRERDRESCPSPQ